MTETVTQAALWVEDQLVTLPRPAHHHHLLQALGKLVESVKGCKNERENFWVLMKDQGFLTSQGRFVRREEAAAIAYEAGQIKPCLFG